MNLEQLDFKKIADKNDLLFIGSSSIRLWNDIENDMQSYSSVKRGYGGAHYYDLIHFTERLITNHSPKAILIFVANDITGSNDVFKTNNDLSPKEVKRLFKYCYKSIRKIHKQVSVFVIETTPTPSRSGVWDKISEANDLINSYCESKLNLHFITTRGKFIDDNGLPIKSFFISVLFFIAFGRTQGSSVSIIVFKLVFRIFHIAIGHVFGSTCTLWLFKAET